jgi:hypothetical protein
VPEITAVVFDCTLWVLTVNVALVFPAATVTLEGTVATDVLLLVSVTTAPPEGAAELRVTVPVELFLPLTLVGFRVSEERLPADPPVMVRKACATLDPSVAVIAAVKVPLTGVVVTVNEALVLPAATVTLPGTLAELKLLESDTVAPPEGAGPSRVTVPCDDEPPVTLVGFKVTVVTANAGVMVREVSKELAPMVAVIDTFVVEVTDDVVTVNEAVVLPAATVTLPGTLAAVLLLESETTSPPEGAAALRVTVPVELFPPTTVVGFNVILETVGPQAVLAFTVKLAETFAPPDEAKIGTVKLALLHSVPIEKLRLVWPAGTVTVTGSCTGGSGSPPMAWLGCTKT